VDYVAVVVRGFVPGTTAPAGGGDPRILGQLVDAINRRGVADRLKVLPFDDTPASWTDKKNQIAHHTGGYDPLFDVGDSTGLAIGGGAVIVCPAPVFALVPGILASAVGRADGVFLGRIGPVGMRRPDRILRHDQAPASSSTQRLWTVR
jgi:hypothetical protein